MPLHQGQGIFGDIWGAECFGQGGRCDIHHFARPERLAHRIVGFGFHTPDARLGLQRFDRDGDARDQTPPPMLTTTSVRYPACPPATPGRWCRRRPSETGCRKDAGDPTLLLVLVRPGEYLREGRRQVHRGAVSPRGFDVVPGRGFRHADESGSAKLPAGVGHALGEVSAADPDHAVLPLIGGQLQNLGECPPRLEGAGFPGTVELQVEVRAQLAAEGGVLLQDVRFT